MPRLPRPTQPANVPLAQSVLGGPYYQQQYFNLLFLAAVTSD